MENILIFTHKYHHPFIFFPETCTYFFPKMKLCNTILHNLGNVLADDYTRSMCFPAGSYFSAWLGRDNNATIEQHQYQSCLMQIFLIFSKQLSVSTSKKVRPDTSLASLARLARFWYAEYLSPFSERVLLCCNSASILLSWAPTQICLCYSLSGNKGNHSHPNIQHYEYIVQVGWDLRPRIWEGMLRKTGHWICLDCYTWTHSACNDPHVIQ